MKNRYAVLIEGSNLLTKLGHVGKFGYFTTRYVEADNKDDASTIALVLVKDELSSKNLVLNDHGDLPVIKVSKINLLKSFDEGQAPGKGFTFFPEEQRK